MRNNLHYVSIFLIIFLLTACSKENDLLDTEDIATPAFALDDTADDLAFERNTLNAAGVTTLSNDVVEKWTEVLLEVERYAAGMRPNASARALAYIYLASYETAVPGMSDHISSVTALHGTDIELPQLRRPVHWELALNESFRITLNHFLINVPATTKSKINALHASLDQELSRGLSRRMINQSKQWGALVANTVIRYSQTDRSAERQILEPQPRSYEPPTGAGYWTYSAEPERALFPYWGTARAFVIPPNRTRSVRPLTYSENPNSPYFKEMMETYEVSTAAKANADESLWIAEFWSDDVEGMMFSPPARQFSIANQLINQYDLNLEETLVLYLKLGVSLNDAAVATWKYKYQYMVMRPNVFIQDFIDPNYQTNLYRLIYWPNPTFPSYPSGHSCFASAAAGIFIDFFGNSTNFTDYSHDGRQEFIGKPRTFYSFEAMASENAFSRIPLGVHIRMDCEEGLRLGYEIADAINRVDLRKNAG
ncbi:MAG: vanadium-dependent haloperoxidase [Bacteroidota bacterium]